MAIAHKRFNLLTSYRYKATPSMTLKTSNHTSKTPIYLYKETANWRPDFIMHKTPVISGEEQVWMQMEFEEQEVLNAFKICVGDKAPGPDHFPMCFYQTYRMFLD